MHGTGPTLSRTRDSTTAEPGYGVLVFLETEQEVVAVADPSRHFDLGCVYFLVFYAPGTFHLLHVLEASGGIYSRRRRP